MNVQQDLLVHCLECDNTYRESEELSIAVCPHCNNPDPHKTVYIEDERDRCAECDCVLTSHESETLCRWCEERKEKEND